MSGNVWIFAILAVVVVGVFSVSLYWAGGRDKSGGAPRWQPLALAVAVPLIVAGLYVLRGTPQAIDLQAAAHGAGMPGGTPPDPKAMVASLEKRLQDNPGDLDGWLMLARSYEVLERFPEAAAAYERAQSKVMDDSNLLVNWIELRLMSNNRQFDPRTLELLDHAAKLAPDDPDVMLLRALAAFDKGDKTASDAIISQLHERLPPGSTQRKNIDEVLRIWTTRAAPVAQSAQGQTIPSLPQNPHASGASAASTSAPVPDVNTMVQRLADRLKDHPEDLNGWLMLARSYAMLGRYADADAAYQIAQERAMQDSGALVLWVKVRLALGEHKFDARGRELLAQAAKLTPDDPDVLLLRALAAFDSGDKPGGNALAGKLRERFAAGTPARQKLDAALAPGAGRDKLIALGPLDPPPLPTAMPPAAPPSANPAPNAPADASGAPDPKVMVQRLADQLKEHPEDMQGWLMLARSYAILGRYTDADDAFQHAQQQALQDSAMLTIWIEVRLRRNGMRFDDRARELLKAATALAPDDTGVLLMRALAAFDSGDKASGDALVDKLHQRVPANSPDRQNLDAALEQLRPPGARGKP